MMRWGVPEGFRETQSGDLVHDDLLISAALCSLLDGLEWSVAGEVVVIQGVDPLEEMSRGF